MEINSTDVTTGPAGDADSINAPVLDVQENALRFIARLIAQRYIKDMQLSTSSKSVINRNNNPELKNK